MADGVLRAVERRFELSHSDVPDEVLRRSADVRNEASIPACCLGGTVRFGVQLNL